MDANLAELLAQVEDEWRELRARLEGVEAERLTRPGPRGTWPVIDNLRHLLFAEELHLGRFVQGGWTFGPLGLPPTGMAAKPRFAHMAAAGTPVEPTAIFAAWESAHAEIVRGLVETPEVLHRLDRHVHHLRAHARVIGRLLR